MATHDDASERTNAWSADDAFEDSQDCADDVIEESDGAGDSDTGEPELCVPHLNPRPLLSPLAAAASLCRSRRLIPLVMDEHGIRRASEAPPAAPAA